MRYIQHVPMHEFLQIEHTFHDPDLPSETALFSYEETLQIVNDHADGKSHPDLDIIVTYQDHEVVAYNLSTASDKFTHLGYIL